MQNSKQSHEQNNIQINNQLNNPDGVTQLINYYQELININNKFNDIHEVNNQNANYKILLEQLIIIQDALITKETSNINAIYKPLEKLLNNKAHFDLLESTISLYKQDSSLTYLRPENRNHNLQQHNLHNPKLPPSLMDDNAQQQNQHQNVMLEQNNTILNNLADLQKSIQELKNNDFTFVITKSTNDMIAAFDTNYELMKFDITRYDTMLTEHINKSGIITTEAIEKEHARFAQKIAADSNTIISGIIDGVTARDNLYTLSHANQGETAA